MPDNPDSNIAKLEAGSNLPSDKQFYANGFAVGITAADIVVVFLRDNQPIAKINIAHSVAKALSEILASLILSFQKKTKLRIMNVNDLAEKMNQPESDDA
jgi:hypothetical protein